MPYHVATWPSPKCRYIDAVAMATHGVVLRHFRRKVLQGGIESVGEEAVAHTLISYTLKERLLPFSWGEPELAPHR